MILAVSSVHGQQPAATGKPLSSGAGSVIGRVVNEGTDAPVGFAEIHLIPKPAFTGSEAAADQPEANPPKPRVDRVLGRAGMDGSFRMDGVPPGDYFAGAVFPGYVAPGVSADASATEDQLKRLVATLPVIHIGPGQVAKVNLVLRRGAVIGGRVQFADGRPAVGLSVEWELAENNLAIESVRMAKPSPSQQIMQSFQWYTNHDHRDTTDDEGRFRIFGLPPGNYIISTILPSQLTSTAQVILSDGSSPEPARPESPYPEMTVVYGPGVFRRNDAKVFEIRGSEEVLNADLKVDPGGLHMVRGRVLADGDHHVPGTVLLRLQENGGKDVGKFVAVKEEGSYQFDYLPSGSYTLQLLGATDNSNAEAAGGVPHDMRHYKAPKLAVVVGDHDVVLDDLLLTPLKSGEAIEYPQ